MHNLFRNLSSLISVWRAGERVYSPPAYALGLGLAARNAGTGPVAWLRGWPRPRIHAPPGVVEIGHAALYPGVRLQCRRHGRIRVGDGSFINHDTRIRSRTAVEIGRHCMVSWDCLITDECANTARPAPVRIGDHCWIGAKVLILGGTTLAAGCIVAAGSIVQGHFPAGVVLAGKPAHPVADEMPPSRDHLAGQPGDRDV